VQSYGKYGTCRIWLNGKRGNDIISARPYAGRGGQYFSQSSRFAYGLPFEVAESPVMTKEEAMAILMTELKKGEDSIARGEPTYTLEEVRVMLGVEE
jgi:hypothetical protein